jgi:hypothetical protein
MALFVDSGTQVTGVTTDDIVISHALTTTPKVCVFWTNFMDDVVDGWESSHIVESIGAVSSSAAFYVHHNSEDSVDPSDVGMRWSEAGCLGYSGAGFNSEAGLAAFESWSSDNITLEVSNAWGASVQVQYLTLGGSDITNVYVGRFTWNASSSDQYVGGVGFQPDMLIFVTPRHTSVPPAGTTRSDVVFGFANSTGSTGMGVHGVSSENGVTTTQTVTYCADGAIGGRMYVGGLAEKMTLEELNSSGFQVGWSSAPIDALHTFFVAIKGGTWSVFQSNTATSTTPWSVTGFGMQPQGGMIFGAGRAEDSGLGSDGRQISVGTWDSTGSQQSMLTWDQDGRDTTVSDTRCQRGIDFDQVYQNNDNGTAIAGTMQVNDILVDGLQFVMTDADPSANFFQGFAVGSAAGEGVLTNYGAMVIADGSVSLTTDTINAMLYTTGWIDESNRIDQNFVDLGSTSDVASYELSSTSYARVGTTGWAVTENDVGNTADIDANDVTFTSLSSAAGPVGGVALLKTTGGADTINPLIGYFDFASAQQTTGTGLTVQWSTTGPFQLST